MVRYPIYFVSLQVKKAKKWACKICGEKQSIKKLHARGSAPDCRRHVQKLNMIQGEIAEGLAAKEDFKAACIEDDAEGDVKQGDIGDDMQDERCQHGSTESKWSRFVERVDMDDGNDDDIRWQGFAVTTDKKLFEARPAKRTKLSKARGNWSNKEANSYNKRADSINESVQASEGICMEGNIHPRKHCREQLGEKQNSLCRKVVLGRPSWTNPRTYGTEKTFPLKREAVHAAARNNSPNLTATQAKKQVVASRSAESNNKSLKWDRFLHPATNKETSENESDEEPCLSTDDSALLLCYDDNNFTCESKTDLGVHVKNVSDRMYTDSASDLLFSIDEELGEDWWKV
ncbi:predicted protein [Nematostella vectensis]|uniref:MRN complex-interacting protein N-terminal domain-containing protein n=1 Tax=Nematostella vectensis TaxID=45351 RepID=A7SF83_NEMVE|nr:predicted protein [Nematostella vectensis]|eukprot:XP_001629724.1 predicted protein [Nematostella vectensis]